jgi:hypothetical protein
MAAPADPYGAEVFGDSPAGWFRLDGDATDYMGGLAGTLTGAPTYTTTALVPYSGAQAINLDGVDDYVTIPRQTALDFSTAMSVEAWVQADSYRAAGYDDVASKHNVWALELNAGRPELYITTGSGVFTATATSAVTLGQTYHLVGTYDGATIRVYLDGAQVASATASGNVSVTADPLYIGVWNGGLNDWFDGRLDEVAFYGRALTATEVADHYAAASTVTGSGSLTARAATASGSGTLTLTGSGTPTATAATLAGAGTLTATGSGAVASQPATLTGSGTVTSDAVTGSGSLTAGASSLTGAGTLTATGSGALTATAATLLATGALETTGTGALTAAAATLAGSGSVGTETVSGTGALTAAKAGLSGGGTLTTVGAGALAAQAATLASAALIQLAGSGAVTSVPATLSGAGTVGDAAPSRNLTVTVGPGASRSLTAAAASRALAAAPAGARGLTVTPASRTLTAAGRSRTLTADPHP